MPQTIQVESKQIFLCLSNGYFNNLPLIKQFFAKTGMCKFGANCKFNHPKDLHKTSDGEHEISTALACINADSTAAIAKPSSGYNAVLYNSKGLPFRAVYLSSLLQLNILKLHRSITTNREVQLSRKLETLGF